jgi:RimJ/RimL family protein N-acetyltransferase
MPTYEEKSSCVSLVSLDLNYLLQESRLSAYVNWLQDEKVTQYLEVRSDEVSKTSITSALSCESPSLESYFFALELEQVGFIGTLRIHSISRARVNTGEVGLMIGDRSQQGKGFGSQALSQACRLGREALDLNQLTAGCYQANSSSYRLFTSHGFKCVGRGRAGPKAKLPHAPTFRFAKRLA